MRTLSAALAVGLLVLVAAPQNALACHQGAPHGNETSCDGAGAPGAGVFQFVGFTDDVPTAADTISGGQGMLAMHALCQDDFGENARMCTSEEFWLSPNAAAAANSWLLKHCTSWATASSTIWGLVVKPDGKPSKGMGEDCDIARPVTCCAPIQ